VEICEDSPHRLVLRDAAGRVWAIRVAFSVFVLAGLLCLGLVLGVIGTSDRPLEAWEFYLGLAIGFGMVCASLGSLAQVPRSQLDFDRIRGTLTIQRSGPLFGRSVRRYVLAEIVTVDVRQTGRDGDGDFTYSAFLNFRDGGCAALTNLHGDRDFLETLTVRVRSFLRLA
jgi:hypothetical protein